ncbi:MAG TPA: phage holin family protein [Candidatus Binatia bacterium]|jgi:uncharacterized membrane protein YqjE|nr:phage holin family protein [Candidatus Binatia bacterium]
MAAEETQTASTSARGLFSSLRSLPAALLDTLKTRLDLLLTELEEERDRLTKILLLAAISLFCLSLGILFLTLFIVAIFWDTHRLYVVGGFAALYLILAGITWLILRKKARLRPKFLSATLSELAKDRDRLRS